MNIETLRSEIARARTENPTWRHGQAAFNTLYRLAHDVADEICSTNDDPFYDDERLPAFFAAVERLLPAWTMLDRCLAIVADVHKEIEDRYDTPCDEANGIEIKIVLRDLARRMQKLGEEK